MRVGRPGVGALHARDEVAEAGRDRRPDPNAPSTCSHAPASSARVRDVRERVERAGVHLARLRADDRRPVAAAECCASASTRIRPCVVGGDDRRRAEAEQAERPVDRHVPLAADEHSDCAARRAAVASTSQPTCSRTWKRAAARPVKFAICAR